MANLVRSRSWGVIQPPPGARVDTGHPLAQDLSACVMFNTGPQASDVVGGRAGTVAGGTPALTKFGGLAVKFNATTLEWDGGVTLPAQDATTTQFSQRARFVKIVDGSNNNGTIVGNRNGGSPGLTFQKLFIANASTACQWQYFTNGTPTTITGTAATTANLLYDVLTVKNGASMLVYVNGVLAATGTIPAGTQAAQPWKIGGDASETPQVAILDAQLWKTRALRPEDAAWLNAEPYAYYAPPGPKVLYFDLGAPIVPSRVTTGSLKVHSRIWNAARWGTVLEELDFSDTSKITSSSGLVSQVDPSSGSLNASVTASGGNRPTTGTRTQNGLNVLDFDGADDWLLVDVADQAQPITLVVVAKSDTVLNNRQMLANAELLTGLPQPTVYGSGEWAFYAGNQVLSGVPFDTTAHVFVAIFDDPGSSQLWIDGVLVADEASGSGDPATNPLRALTIGGDPGTTTPWDGWIGHAVYYAGHVGDAAALSAALNRKWAIY